MAIRFAVCSSFIDYFRIVIAGAVQQVSIELQQRQGKAGGQLKMQFGLAAIKTISFSIETIKLTGLKKPCFCPHPFSLMFL